MPGDCGLVQHIAGDIVSTGWTTWSTYAQNALDDTAAFFDEISALELTPIPTDVTFSVPADLGNPFAKPTVPVEPSIAFGDVTGVGDVDVPAIVLPTFVEAPTLDAVAPAINLPTSPGELAATAPTDEPTVSDVTLPTAPTITLPTEPTLQDITLPAVPTVSLPTFSATAPVMDFVAPGETFDFTYEDYSTQLPTLMTRIQTMLQGGTGLPAAIWNALWGKARAREDATAVKHVQEVTDEWAARGFSLPGGVLDKKIEGVRQANQDADNTLSREIAIEQAKMEVQNLQFSITQGIAFENIQVGLHIQKMQLSYEAAKYTLEASISVFNAKIAQKNVELQVYATQAQVHKTLIEAEMTNIELYRAQLEGQKLVGDINQQDIDLYKARLSSLLTEIEVYKGELDGVRALVEVDKSQVALFTARVNAFAIQVQAKESEVKLYAEQIGGELAKTQIYSSEVNAYAQLVQAYKTGNDAEIDAKKIELQNNGFKLEKYRTQIQKFSAEIDAEAKRVSSGVGIYDGQAKMYTAELSAEQARVIADSRQFDLSMEEAKTEADFDLKEAQLNIEQTLRILTLELERTKTLLGVQSQLAASAMSAVNLSASVGESAGNTTSCATNYSYAY